jgi:two-component system sensor histidine kinase MtrB
VRPGRLRRRLAIAFVLVAGVSAGALALGSYLLVRQARLSDSLDRAKSEAEFDLVLAQGFQPLSAQKKISDLLTSFEQKRVHVVLIAHGTAVASNTTFDPEIPVQLRAVAGEGQLGYQRVTSGRRHLLLVGGRIPGAADELYVVVDESRIVGDLGQLRNVLVLGWLAVTMIAGLVGTVLARRTLEPVAEASEAARKVAEGLMQTRLPVGAEDEFGAWASSFNEMADALEAKIAALSEAQARERRFTSDVAHELRTPLTALVAEASLLAERLADMPEVARRPAELLIQDVSRLRRLVDELMEVSRFDAGAETVRPEPVALRALADAVIRSRGWGGQVAVDGPELTLVTDRRRVERILSNLVGNAVEHGGRDVRIRVRIESADAVIEVADDGPGVGLEHLPHLFDRFYKADPSRSTGGSGLGLAIARENARLLGGDVEVWSELGAGTRFTVTLPVGERLPGGEAVVSSPGEHEAHVPGQGGRP